MPGATPGGWPYALPADARVDWPATSRQLAEKIETVLNPVDGPAITPAAGWTQSPTYGNWIQKSGSSASLSLSIQRSSDLAITAGTYVTIATLPAGFAPPSGKAALDNGIYGTGNTVRVEVLSNGTVRARFATAFTFTSGMDLGFTTTYPLAP